MLFEDDDDESLVVVGDDDDKGMLDLSWLWLLPKFGFNISDIKNDFIWVVCFFFNNVGDEGDDDNDIDDDLEYVESGEDKNSWWSLAPMIKPCFSFFDNFNIHCLSSKSQIANWWCKLLSLSYSLVSLLYDWSIAITFLRFFSSSSSFHVMRDERIIQSNQSCKEILVICLPNAREREREKANMNDDDEDDEQKLQLLLSSSNDTSKEEIRNKKFVRSFIANMC